MLLPGQMEGRTVRQGVLGCPVCRGEFGIEDGVVRFGEPAPSAGGPAVSAAGEPDADAVLALLGLEGPGGYLALAGAADRLAAGLAALLPGIHLVLINPPAARPGPSWSIIRTPRWPLRARSLRGAVLGPGMGSGEGEREAAVQAVLPGLRVVGIGDPPARPELELLGHAGGWWVGKRR